MPDDRKFHAIAALCGDGLRPELQALFESLANPSELSVRPTAWSNLAQLPLKKKAKLDVRKRVA